MKKTRLAGRLLVILAAVLIIAGVLRYQKDYSGEILEFRAVMTADEALTSRLYYETEAGSGFSEERSVPASYGVPGKTLSMSFAVPSAAVTLKYVPAEEAVSTSVSGYGLYYQGTLLTDEAPDKDGIIKLDQTFIQERIRSSHRAGDAAVKAALCLFTAVLAILLVLHWDSFLAVPAEVLKEKKLILELAKNDFRTKFAGSLLGTVWAFIQPVVTVFVYWFVFEKALNVGTQSTKAGITVPFVLWLIGGLVPWFFFSDALSAGTNVLLEYSYLVKKLVFNISVLPVVKILSCLFVHAFFMVFTIGMYLFYGHYPDIYMLQLLYYSAALICLCMGIIYLTSSIVVFFRDLSQIVNIVLQVGVWFTPIMWNIDAMNITGILLFILKLNPMYYIVMGYRDSLISHVWFWERPGETLYFWLLTVLLYYLGTSVFGKLKVHFADVL